MSESTNRQAKSSALPFIVMPVGGALLAAYSGYGLPSAILGGFLGLVIAVLDHRFTRNAAS
jgi:hypothetical protein